MKPVITPETAFYLDPPRIIGTVTTLTRNYYTFENIDGEWVWQFISSKSEMSVVE